MTGHNPHRAEGKAADMEHLRRRSIANESLNPNTAAEPPQPNEVPAEEARGGSRPGVPRRMLGETDE